jgi:diguanylate cyclase (GGDEF)-like protein
MSSQDPKGDKSWQLVMTDPETGLPNQLVVKDRLAQARARRPRHGGEVAELSIMLDNLGRLIDEHGPKAGNFVICEAAERLTAALRTEDTVGRVGRNELVGVITVAEEENLAPLVDRLQKALAEPIELSDDTRVQLEATVSVQLAND